MKIEQITDETSVPFKWVLVTAGCFLGITGTLIIGSFTIGSAVTRISFAQDMDHGEIAEIKMDRKAGKIFYDQKLEKIAADVGEIKGQVKVLYENRRR